MCWFGDVTIATMFPTRLLPLNEGMDRLNLRLISNTNQWDTPGHHLVATGLRMIGGTGYLARMESDCCPLLGSITRYIGYGRDSFSHCCTVGDQRLLFWRRNHDTVRTHVIVEMYRPVPVDSR